MSRIRTVKPELFRHDDLFDTEQQTQLPLRLVFIGLFTCCDREGRFRWRPRQLKLDILPYDAIDFSLVLNALAKQGFIIKYEVNGEYYGCIPSWHKHQCINNRETESVCPPLHENNPMISCTSEDSKAGESKSEPLVYQHAAVYASPTREARADHALSTVSQCPLEENKYYPVEGEGEYGIGKGTGRGNKKEENQHSKILRPCQEDEPVKIEVPTAITLSSSSSVTSIPLRDKTEFIITQAMLDEWQQLYPLVNVLQQLKHIRGWNLANPNKQKSQHTIAQHIHSWLAKENTKEGSSREKSGGFNLLEHNLHVAHAWASQNELHNKKRAVQ